ncbi:unnamed protein product [Cuscuta epithymum]|uniref:Uncharacterized protein n=1 Tax=Cuscuta epithymum TaxID=186058 RepID=A0AAV0D086_9ASTE|nr:unnamed protein product [Cuscuta epithymum]
MDGSEMARVLKRFGDDEQSTLLDQYERLTFEVQLNRAILGRSASDQPYRPRLAPPLVLEKGKRRRRICLGLRKAVKKLMRPILGSKKKVVVNDDDDGDGGLSPADPKHPTGWKAFSKSMRF